jgi:hypothetical protein
MIKGNFGDFSNQIGKLIDGYKGRMDALVQTATFDLFETIVKRTPGPGNSIQKKPAPGTPTGFLRGSWYVSIGSDSGASKGRPDPSGGVTIASINAGLSKAKAGDTIYFLNAAKYALRLEFGFVGTDSLGRTYNQAPRSFVRSSAAEFPKILAEAAQRIAAKA